MLDADAVIIVLQLAAEMIFETATRHDRRNFYNSFGGLLPIVMHKTLYLFRNINRLVTPERRRWQRFEGDCMLKDNQLRILSYVVLICAKNQSVVQKTRKDSWGSDNSAVLRTRL